MPAKKKTVTKKKTPTAKEETKPKAEPKAEPKDDPPPVKEETPANAGTVILIHKENSRLGLAESSSNGIVFLDGRAAVAEDVAERLVGRNSAIFAIEK